MFEKQYSVHRNPDSLGLFRKTVASELNAHFEKNLIHSDINSSLHIKYMNKFNEEILSYFELAIYEIIINVIDHSILPDGSDPDITVKIHAGEKKLKAAIEYYAEEFDFISKELPVIKSHFAAGKSRGLGVYIIRRLMDSCSYIFDDKKNTITIEKAVKIKLPGISGKLLKN